MDLSFTIAAGPRQRSHSQVRVPRDSRPHFVVSDSRVPQPGGSGPCIYIPQEQGDPVIPPGTRFLFRRLLRLAVLRWRYPTPPPQLDIPIQTLHEPNRKHRLQKFFYSFVCIIAAVTWFVCSGNLFTEPFPSNDHLLWFCYSDFQQTCHNTYQNPIPSLLRSYIRSARKHEWVHLPWAKERCLCFQ
jgi:hypothetical protein